VAFKSQWLAPTPGVAVTTRRPPDSPNTLLCYSRAAVRDKFVRAARQRLLNLLGIGPRIPKAIIALTVLEKRKLSL